MAEFTSIFNAFFSLTEKDVVSLLGLALIASVHILCGRSNWWRFFEAHGWVSFSAGASVAYVFIHLSPEVAIFQHQMNGMPSHHYNGQFFSQPLYLTALIGLCLPYLLDTIELNYAEQHPGIQRKIHHSVFTIKNLQYVFYNIMIGYMIINRRGEGLLHMEFIILAIAVHFIVMNATFREDYKELFAKYTRWLAVLGLVIGTIIGILMDMPDNLLAYLFSFIGGIITYTALKEELPKTSHRAPFHFLAGVALYTLLILAIPYIGLNQTT